ncbi:MAG TPA: cold shock domain-containing protein [Burkholderiaceae bacterium]
MRFEGTLRTWSEDRGYGQIDPSDGGDLLFVHISAFPSDTYLPQRGERLSFEVQIGANGQKQAARVQRIRMAVQQNGPLRTKHKPSSRPNWMLVTTLALVAVAVGGVEVIRAYQPEASQHVASLGKTFR